MLAILKNVLDTSDKYYKRIPFYYQGSLLDSVDSFNSGYFFGGKNSIFFVFSGFLYYGYKLNILEFKC